MGRITRAKAADMRIHDNASIDAINSSGPHEANAGVGQSHLPADDMKTQEEDAEMAATIGEPAQRAATPVFDSMPNTLQRGSSPTRLFASTTGNRGSPEAKDAATSGNSTMNSPNTSSTYDLLEAAAVQAQTPPRAGRVLTSEDPITALDELDEAVETINAEVPDVQTSPQKPKSKKTPFVRSTKASQARVSLAHGPKDPQRRTSSWGKPPAQSAGQRVPSASSSKSNEEALPKKEVEIPHSKPRPISMSFPTPPPPPKSTKAPTTSNFQLPGEAIAAKLKAAKEARLQNEAEDQKKKTFKARPAPCMTKAPTVRQTSTSKAREFLMNGKPPAISDGAKRANSATSTRPSTASSRPQSAQPVASSATQPASIKPSVASTSTVKATSRPSTAMASWTTQSRPASSADPVKPTSPTSPTSAATGSTARPASRATSGTSKGREVFQRASQAKALAEQEKRQKEEAAKRARAEAAERTRQQSREWAEKQRAKKLGIKPPTKPKENVDPVEDDQAGEQDAEVEY